MTTPLAETLLIVCQPGRMGGRPTIGESRLTVECIASWIQQGYSDEYILEQYPSIIGGVTSIRVLRRLIEEVPRDVVFVAEVEELKLRVETLERKTGFEWIAGEGGGNG